jgi:hypothetical protein
MYKLIKSEIDGAIHSIFRQLDNTIIPMVEDNIDYQAYLKWLAEGNTPEPADGEQA